MPSHLFSPITLGAMPLRNRIVVSPMGMHSAVDGVAADWHLMHLGQFAVSGAGLVITEAVAVEPRGRVSRGDLGLWSDEQVKGFLRIRSFYDTYGSARLGVQLGHAGRKGSVTTSWEGQGAVPVGAGGWETLSASAIAYPGRNTPTAIDRSEMIRVREMFATAARNAARAGFELIELHAAHGYLLHNFLSPLTNRRDDAYGGSLANRMRFPLEVFAAVRDAVPPGMPVGARVSATDWAPNGWELPDTLEFCAALKAAGCAFVCASSGGSVPEQQIPVGPLYQVPFAKALREATGLPAMAVGLITEPEQAESIVASGQADLVALGRTMLYQPRWPWLAAERLGANADYPRQYDRAHPSMRRSAAFNVAREGIS
jgi:2,4-dienoyl-CoA reductase-like NADH-dependent reductase (Old Yellow Enzyme family)